MSDTQQGPGWWRASDGRWYPPETHPNYRPTAPAMRPAQLPRRLASERVVIQSPTSYTGSARRIWKLTDRAQAWLRFTVMPVAIVLVLIAWVLCTVWYFLFGLFLVPWRLIRRGGRKRKRDELRHREVLDQRAVG